ncbi:uncharacterized protein EV420DRAFT_1531101 [Desarmillaria tabescens]|uniref:GRF-type domain-containing protein n=1 Tax=Armillaria tabescens TaxID=1929756 RepID=A0AA39N909_ARMTA|nr:uncharacterized protein EV420DRAFT_1531101 [Desarmillaria tabescens]KAK0461255.1 hypothetical protein EV420DRAFT_1531101 [Desarmillaria tabescens]
MALARNNVAVDDHENPLCKCGLRARVITSRGITHPDRDYYRCPKERNDPTLCRLFVWVDEAIMPTLKRNLATDAEQESPSKRTRTALPPTTPIKKPYSNFPSTPASKQKRIEDIKSGLTSPTTPTTDSKKNRLEQNERDGDVFSSPSSSLRQREYVLPPVKQEGDDEAPVPQANLPTPGSIQTSLVDATESILNDMTVLRDEVATIWRLKVAAERGRDAKARRIEQLEARVRELETENERYVCLFSVLCCNFSYLEG